MAIIKKNKKTMPREKEALIELIWCDLVNGLSRYQIKLKLDRDGYDGHETSKLSRSCKSNYIQEAMLNCQEDLQEKKEQQRDLFFQQILAVYNDSMLTGDRQAALKALDMIGKLGGHYAKTENDINISGTINANITFGLEDEEDNDD